MVGVRSTPAGTMKLDVGREKVDDMRLKVDDMWLSPNVDEGRRKKSDHDEDERLMKLSPDSARSSPAAVKGSVATDTLGAAAGHDIDIGGSMEFPVLSWFFIRNIAAALSFVSPMLNRMLPRGG